MGRDRFGTAQYDYVVDRAKTLDLCTHRIRSCFGYQQDRGAVSPCEARTCERIGVITCRGDVHTIGTCGEDRL